MPGFPPEAGKPRLIALRAIPERPDASGLSARNDISRGCRRRAVGKRGRGDRPFPSRGRLGHI
jgi:hypothetical protein